MPWVSQLQKEARWSPVWRLCSRSPSLTQHVLALAQGSGQCNLQWWQLNSSELGSPMSANPMFWPAPGELALQYLLAGVTGYCSELDSHWKQKTVWILYQWAKRILLINTEDWSHQSYAIPFDWLCFILIWPFNFFTFSLLLSKAELKKPTCIKDEFEWKWFMCFTAMLRPFSRKNGKIQSGWKNFKQRQR